MHCDAELVGWGFFCVEVRDTRAGLALVRCAPPGRWEAELVEQDLVRPEEFADAVEVAGGPWTGAATTRSRPGSGTPCAPPSTYKKKREEKVWVASPLTPVRPGPSEEVLAVLRHVLGGLPGGYTRCRGKANWEPAPLFAPPVAV